MTSDVMFRYITSILFNELFVLSSNEKLFLILRFQLEFTILFDTCYKDIRCLFTFFSYCYFAFKLIYSDSFQNFSLIGIDIRYIFLFN